MTKEQGLTIWSLPKLGSNGSTIPWHTSIMAPCSYSAQKRWGIIYNSGWFKTNKNPRGQKKEVIQAILKNFQYWSHQQTQTPFGTLCLQHPWPFPITRTTNPGASASAPSLSPGTRKDIGSSLSLSFLQELRERDALAEGISGAGGWGSPISRQAAAPQERAFHLMCVSEKSLWWGLWHGGWR